MEKLTSPAYSVPTLLTDRFKVRLNACILGLKFFSDLAERGA